MIKRQTVTLEIDYDDEHELEPRYWNWGKLLDVGARVPAIRVFDISEPITIVDTSN